jgi:rRNA maturation endonuclease Nob1
MKTKDALLNLRNNNIDEETRQFLIQKLTSKPLVMDDRYYYLRCPTCSTVMFGIYDKYCRQCGQRIKEK